LVFAVCVFFFFGGPRRAGPHRTAPKTDTEATGDAGARGPAKPYEPLLTEQELRALIGDDLASLGPERGAPDADADEDEA